jgi:hypothetical protein
MLLQCEDSPDFETFRRPGPNVYFEDCEIDGYVILPNTMEAFEQHEFYITEEKCIISYSLQ